MRHLLKIGMATLIVLCFGIASAQQTGWAGENPTQRSGNCSFFTLTPNPSNATCNGANNGIASVIITGGVGPFTFIWVGGPTTQSWSGVGAGTYTVIVFDQGQGGAACNIDVIVNEPGPLSVFAMNAVSPTCFGACNGTAAPIVIGGAGGYSFSWSNGQSGPSANNLCNPFSLTITDASGCFTDTTYQFQNEPQEIIIDGSVTQISCFGQNDGAIDIDIVGGSPGFTYSWAGPNGFASGSQNIANLDEGSYTITVTDQNNCQADATFNITEPEEITVVADITENACATDTLASISITISGGAFPYSVSWNGPNSFTAASENISNLATGTYNLILTDSNNCAFNASYEVTAPPLIEITLTATDVSCAGEDDGTITTEITGGSGNYTLFWTGPNGFTSGNQNLTNLEAGIYEVTVTDDTGCENTASVEILDADIIIVNTTFTDVTCAGEDDGTITLSISGGNPVYSVAWTGPNGFTSNDESLVDIQAGTYSYTITDQNNCETTGDVTIQEPDALIINGTTEDVLCGGSNTGFITLTVSGGQPDYEFVWSGPNGFSSNNQNITDLEPGVYSVAVTDSENCSQSSQFTILEDDPIVLDATVVQPDCDITTGSITLTITGGNPVLDGGGNPIYIIQWTGPDGFSAAIANIDLLVPGSYTVVVDDGNGCENTTDFAINEPDDLELSATIQSVSCAGNDGFINLTIDGGTPDFTILWSGPNGFNSSQQNINNLLPGSYTVLVTDVNNCSSTETFEINDTEPIVINATLNDVQCQGVTDGSILLDVTGGISPYTFQWSGPGGFSSTDQDIFSLEDGTYTVIVTDSAGCTAQDSFTLVELIGLIAEATITDADCENNDDGAITIELSGGTPSYSTFWLGPNGFTANGLTITGLQAGEYIFVATDAADCFIEQPFIVNNPSSLTVDADITDLLCNGAASGAISIAINGAIPVLSYSWTGPNGFTSSSQNISGLAGGTYTLTITDANNCLLIESFNVIEPDALSITLNETQPDCGQTNGSITSTVNGGTTDYSYEWTDALNNVIGATSTLINLGAGTFTLTVTDANNCVASATATFTESDLIVTADITPVSCAGIDNGAISLNISGGAQPYVVVWSGPNGFSSNNPSISSLAAGDYTVVVVDDNNCSFTETYTVGEAPVSITADVSNPQCQGVSNGSITLTLTGGNDPLSILWSGPGGFTSTDQNIDNLEAGTYNVIITDALDCTIEDSFTLMDLEGLTAIATITDADCENNDDGAITIELSGGTPSYSTFWLGPNGFTANGLTITGLQAGEYIFVATDAADCFIEQPFIVNNPSSLTVDADITDLLCNGAASGAISIAINGAIPVLSYSWTGPNGFTSSSQNISGLAGGTYTLTITDANNCLLIESFNVIEPDALSITLNETQPDCGQTNGSITSTVNGGTTDYSYEWTDALNNVIGATSTLINLGAGTFTLTVTDANNCVASATATFTESDLIVTADITPVSCAGIDNGAISLNISGGAQPYVVVWSGPNGFSSNNPSISSLAAGDYTVVVVDDNNCSFTDTYTIQAADTIDIDAALTPAGCAGQNAGSITLTITGGTPNYSFVWTGPNGFTSTNQNINNLAAGSYLVDVTDASSCFATASFTVIEALPIIVDAEINDVKCQGVEDGFINLTHSGGSPPLTFSWVGPNGFTSTDQDIIGLLAGEYTVTVTDNLGCTQQETYTLIEIEGLTIEATITDANCADNDDGAISVEIFGGTPPYSTFWLGPNGFTANGLSISGLEAGVYTFVATDSEDCFIEIPLVVNNPSSVTATADITNVLCSGESNGAITLTLDGAGLIEITWSGPNGFSSNDQNISSLIAGNYQLTITDVDGCLFNAFYEVTEPDALVVSVQTTQPTCALSNGQLVANISGGTPAYQILWTDALNNILGTDPALSDLAAGTYTLTVADDNGCSYSETFELIDSNITVNATITEILCHQDNNGAISLDITGGQQPYIVVWSGPNGFSSNSPSISNLSPGTYDVTILDDSNCSVSLSFEITEPALLELTTTANPSSCLQNNGSVSTIITGGTIATEYNISWLDANNIEIGTNATLNNLPAGIYTVIVSDDNGCETTAQTAVSDQDGTISATLQNPTCGGANDGSISVEITGGTEPYTYLWSGPNGFTSTNQNITDLETGVYTINVTDSLGCVFTDLFDLTEPETFSLDIVATPVACFGDENGTITLTIDGGISPFQIVWTGPNGFSSTDQNLTNLAAGTYSVVVIDSITCVSTGLAEIISPNPITADFEITNNLCASDTTGSITVTLTGGNNPFIFQWISSNGFSSDQQNISNLAPGFYELLVTDSLGCSAQFDATITSSPELLADFATTPPTCFGDETGMIEALGSGGTPNYTYSWSGPNGFSSNAASIENLAAGTYFLTLTDSNFCAIQDSIVLTQPDSLFAAITATNVLCFGDENGTIEAIINGGTAPFTSSWTGPDGFSSSELTLENLLPGSYNLSVADSNGCVYNTAVLISVPEVLSVTLIQAMDALCNTDNSGSAEVAVEGGTQPYTFSWTGPNEYSNDVQNPDDLFPGTYNLQLTDTNGCAASLEVTIGFTFEISADAGADFGICREDQPIVLNGTSVNATDVQWLNPQGFVISNEPTVETLSIPGTFTYYFVASNGLCTAMDSVTVTIYPQPTVSAGVNETIFEGDAAILGGFPTSPTGVIYDWSPGASLVDSTVANPIATPIVTTQYTVTVTDANGCVGIDSLVITVIPEIRFPSGITPNGDGINDTWIIDYIDLYPNNVVEIYSRWGDRLYRVEGYDNNNPWDGFYNGKELPVGTYYYIVELRDERYPEPFTGPITIFR
jgi:gliding motility-associated-like protein